MIKLEQISLPIKFSEDDIKRLVAKSLKLSINEIIAYEILKLSIDARKKPNVKYIASIGVCLKNENKFKHLNFEKNNKTLTYKHRQLKKRPIVVGFGPSGMFASLALARMGLKPIILEQGKKVKEREKDVLNFWNDRVLNKYSNVQFGEGGAGTFSDGKLNTNLNNEYCQIVTNEFLNFGAPKEIGYINKPHIGSDNLKTIVKNIREHILSLGGTFMFSTRLKDIELSNGQVCSAVCENVESGENFKLDADKILLCIGHSARETYEMLHAKNIEIKQKPFAMGVRIEQRQADINLSQFGAEKIDGLPNADYKLAVHLPNGRSVFTFCMCPGGQVVASSSDGGEIVTNGMSYFARDGENANSALLVNVLPSDYGSNHPLAGVEFQKRFEKLAFKLGGENYNAPAQSVGNFLGEDAKVQVKPSYRPGITMCDIKNCLPSFVAESLKMAIPLLNKKMKNFARNENLLVAIESRSSSPITIVRNDNFEASISGIYPVGEGAGYAGGIISSAVDGIKVAEAIYKKI